MRDCKFCQRFWAGVYTYGFPIVTGVMIALCIGLYVMVML
jgi:hypothetical protein